MVLRWVLYFDEARRIFGHSTVSMFFGTIPMGLATIINGFLVFGVPRWGEGMVQVAEVLWWIDVAMALGCGVLIPYLMFTRQDHSIDQMTAVWLLPVVAAEVAAASGGLLAPYLSDTAMQFHVLITSYVLWAFSVPVAFSILTILILRMALHKLPHESMAASSWLALGPIGTGALGLLLLGADAPAIFAANGLARIGEIVEGLGLISGVILWGVGLWWIVMAALITIRYFRSGIPFNLGWWGFTFPLGVYSLATLRLGSMLHLSFFDVAGCVLVLALAFFTRHCRVSCRPAADRSPLRTSQPGHFDTGEKMLPAMAQKSPASTANRTARLPACFPRNAQALQRCANARLPLAPRSSPGPVAGSSQAGRQPWP